MPILLHLGAGFAPRLRQAPGASWAPATTTVATIGQNSKQSTKKYAQYRASRRTVSASTAAVIVRALAVSGRPYTRAAETHLSPGTGVPPATRAHPSDRMANGPKCRPGPSNRVLKAFSEIAHRATSTALVKRRSTSRCGRIEAPRCRDLSQGTGCFPALSRPGECMVTSEDFKRIQWNVEDHAMVQYRCP